VYFALLDAMLAKGCDPDVCWDIESSGASTTLLMRCGHVTAQRLLTAGANPLLRDLQGRTAMHYARNAEHIQLLMAHDLDVNDLSQPTDSAEADRPLHYNLSGWSEDAPVESVAALLEQGADPAFTDGAGRNAWWHCRHLECASLLEIQLPFDASLRSPHGGTVVYYLIECGHRIYEHSASLLKYYGDHGLNINAQDHDGNTALHAMAKLYDSIHDKPSMAYLLDVGADWSIQNHQGKTPKQMLKKKYLVDWK
jgi:ankyrin repeat protein